MFFFKLKRISVDTPIKLYLFIFLKKKNVYFFSARTCSSELSIHQIMYHDFHKSNKQQKNYNNRTVDN